MSRSRYTLLINSLIHSLIHWLIKKKFQTVSRTCASGVSYYISSSCFEMPSTITIIYVCWLYHLFRSSKPERKSPLSPTSPACSPNISVGPPQSPPSHPYTNLFNSGLYQQYLGQLLANSNNSGHHGPGPGHGPALNPMLLQAQIAMAAQNNLHNNPLLASYNNHANMISERLKQNQNRFSPYSSPASSMSSSHSPLTSGIASAFKALGAGAKLPTPEESSSPPVSPPHSSSPPPSLAVSPSSVKSEPGTANSSSPLRSDIKNIENMINGLNGTSEGRFSLSHPGGANNPPESRVS